jgi:alkylhydroperoxidase family enzyme
MPRITEAGGLTGFAGVYMQKPELWKAFQFHYGALWEYSSLDATTKDLLRLKSANINGCRY